MREISLDELKRIELDILRDVDSFCEKHSIRYYLCGGTLLGAIRHKGFIPWDDDIDIIMPRNDYMKFLQLYNLNNSNYLVHSSFNDDDWYASFAEVEDTRTIKEYLGFSNKTRCGVNIDVFPTDGSPNNYLLRRTYWWINNVLSRIAVLSYQEYKVSKHYSDLDTGFSSIKTLLRTTIKFLAIPVARMTRVFNINLLVNKLAMRFDVSNSKYIGCSVFPHYGYRECIKAEGFLNVMKREFEGEFFNTPLAYEEYLSNLYRDYMKIPPKDKQVSHHDFIAYWKD